MHTCLFITFARGFASHLSSIFCQALLNEQKSAQDNQHLPTTLPRILSWTVTTTSVPLALPQVVAGVVAETAGWSVSSCQRSKSQESASSSDDEEERSKGASESESSSSSSEQSIQKPVSVPQPARPPLRSPTSASYLATGGTPWASGQHGNLQHNRGYLPVQHRQGIGPPCFGGRMSQPPVAMLEGFGKQRPPGYLAMGGSKGLGLWRGAGPMGQQNPAWGPLQSQTPNASCWGEWKAKVMQEELVSRDRVSQSNNSFIVLQIILMSCMVTCTSSNVALQK